MPIHPQHVRVPHVVGVSQFVLGFSAAPRRGGGPAAGAGAIPRAASSSATSHAVRPSPDGSGATWRRGSLSSYTWSLRAASTRPASSSHWASRPACRMVKVRGRAAGANSRTTRWCSRAAVRTRSARASSSGVRAWERCCWYRPASAGATEHPGAPAVAMVPAELTSTPGTCASASSAAADGERQMLAVQTYRILTVNPPRVGSIVPLRHQRSANSTMSRGNRPLIEART